jgi:hypothetical protein
MLTKGIDTTIRELIAQLPQGLSGGATTASDFEKLIAPLAAEISSAIVAASAQTTPAATTASTTTTVSSSAAQSRLSTFQLSVLRDKDSPMLEQLANDLTAGDQQYNQREGLLRERLDLTELEHRLQESAKALMLPTTERSGRDPAQRRHDATHLARASAARQPSKIREAKKATSNVQPTPGQLAQ